MFAPVRGNPARAPVARSYSTPAPVGGWNARDGLADMDVRDAVILDNWFPETSHVELRKGHASHVTGFTTAVESLMAYHSPTASELFASGDSALYDVTAAGARGAAIVGSLGNDRWQHANFGNSAGHFLYMVNGADAPRYYDGSTWTTPTITGSGLTATDLIHVAAHKKRLLFVEKDTLSFWYFPVETISGTITEFNLASHCQLGGYLMAIGTWTRDAGDGIDDLAVFMTSRGEVLIYKGTDPGTAADWLLVGVFRIGVPIGRRCLVKLGADLVVITEDGYMPLARAITARRTSERVAISDKISGAVTQAVSDYKSNFGWQPIFYPAGNRAIFNVPSVETTSSEQHVVNTTTGAWCRFTGMNAVCWEVLDNTLYFGGTTVVYKADTGTNDAGSNIEGAAKSAFSYLGAKSLQKRFTMVRPVIASEGSVGLALAANVDFENRTPTSTPTYIGVAGSPWDTSPWDTSPWATDATIKREWQSVDGVGYAAALFLVASMQNIGCKWYSTDWLYERGGYL